MAPGKNKPCQKSSACPASSDAAAAHSEAPVVPEMCFICNDGPASVTARLCVRLTKKDSKFSQYAAQLLDECLRKVPGSPARKDLKMVSREHSETLLELHQKAKSLGKQGFLQESVAAEGASDNMNIQAVGVGSNERLRERAFWLAMSTAIILRLPKECETILNVWGEGVRNMVKEAWSRFRSILCNKQNISRFSWNFARSEELSKELVVKQ